MPLPIRGLRLNGGHLMKRRKATKNAAKRAPVGRPKSGNPKRVVTLYLEVELYNAVKALHKGEVSSVINDLLRSYLEQKAGKQH